MLLLLLLPSVARLPLLLMLPLLLLPLLLTPLLMLLSPSLLAPMPPQHASVPQPRFHPTPSTQSLLSDPNPNSPANSEAARLYTEDRREYNRRVSG